MRASADEMAGVGVNINGRRINNLRYADDIVLIATSPNELQQLLDRVDHVSTEYNLTISTSKTKVMSTSREDEAINISCQGKRLEQVSSFKYLGSMISQDSNCEKDIRARLGMARSVITSLKTIWKDRSLSKQLKLKLMKSLVWPVATYGCETWTLRKGDIRRIEAFEMYAYRKILNIPRRDHHTNDSVLEERGTVRGLIRHIQTRKLQFFGHVTRANKLTATILQGRLEGIRSRGKGEDRLMT